MALRDGNGAEVTSAGGVSDHGLLTGLADDDHAQYLKTDGTRALTGNWSAGSNRITSVTDPAAAQDAATQNYVLTQAGLLLPKSLFTTKGDLAIATAASTPARHGVPSNGKTIIASSGASDGWTDGDHGDLAGLADDDHTQYILVAGTRAFTGPQSLGSQKITSLADPTAAQEAATKNYVDTSVILTLPTTITSSPWDLRYVCGAIGCGNTGTLAMTVDVLFAIPFIARRTTTLDRIWMEVSTVGTAGSKFRMGIYQNTSDTNLYPAALLVDSGERDGTVSGVHDVTISAALTAGKLYWAACLAGTAAPTMRSISGASIDGSILGCLLAGGANNMNTKISVARAYGALVDPFPASAGLLQANLHEIGIRYST